MGRMKASSRDFCCDVTMPYHLVYWMSFLVFKMGIIITYSVYYQNVLEVLLDTIIMKKYTKWKKMPRPHTNKYITHLLHVYGCNEFDHWLVTYLE